MFGLRLARLRWHFLIITIILLLTAGPVEQTSETMGWREHFSPLLPFLRMTIPVILTAGQVEVAVLLIQGEEVEQHGAGHYQGDSDAGGEDLDIVLDCTIGRCDKTGRSLIYSATIYFRCVTLTKISVISEMLLHVFIPSTLHISTNFCKKLKV